MSRESRQSPVKIDKWDHGGEHSLLCHSTAASTSSLFTSRLACLAPRLFYFHPNTSQTHGQNEAMPTYVRYSFQSSLQVREEDKEATFIRLFSQLKSFNSFQRESMNLTNSL